ncbi:MAG: glycosyltransferase family 2 protein [Planctomycetia bacterium]|uniref:Glycosyltransferase n=1 Tax=Candidatus Brocadia sapporoensis TaxID=392547 RepID=A0A1V6M2V9_9BACT|nr:glycosyltransferase family 2 protein [Candidatus Brocadia sapporoensis]MCC7238339.1 glycosyltransferase family 2 protein [Candidatus Brocadia sp.]QOJ05542.1 MAG: glycosyltransferase family 2 protein [Planctomycetia bacterium]TVL98535.1 MAG: glycosyltransferase [Candidatus Brocadia sp. BL1]MDG6006495.1 glycosyltransferase [Candidatus Brocadia sp.]OQD46741.1 glycosyltransferase [Candidatus Brocadia sapporoensis]
MNPDISIVIPVYNEVDNIEPLGHSIINAMQGQNYEVIFVDDGSTDGSNQKLDEWCVRYTNFRTLHFKINAGQTAAMDAGFKHASGKYVISMDADMQNDPADIPRLIEKLSRYDLVCGWRQKRNDPWLKRISSKVANFIRNKLSQENIKDTGCSLKAYRRECLRQIKLYNGMHRFLPTLFKMEGFTVTEIIVSHYPRKFGKSKYGISNRAFRAFIDLLVVRWMKKRKLNYEIDTG